MFHACSPPSLRARATVRALFCIALSASLAQLALSSRAALEKVELGAGYDSPVVRFEKQEAPWILPLSWDKISNMDRIYLQFFDRALATLADGIQDEKDTSTALVADVHTDGNTGGVLEEGTGFTQVLIAAYALPDQRIVLGAGPVLSYYEFKWPMIDRLTDEKWSALLDSGQAPPEPAWVRAFVDPVALPPEDGDGDRLPDAWERETWNSTSAMDEAQADPDQDGASNLQEFLAGTDPENPQSALRVSSTSPVTLRWVAQEGRQYRVFSSTDLLHWYPLQTVQRGPGQMEVVDSTAPGGAIRFYRVQAMPASAD